MESTRLYLKEFMHLKNYILLILIVTVMSYSVYLFFDEATVASLGDEDHLFEWMTSICFLFCSVIFLRMWVKKKNIMYFLMGAAFFVGFGEEISWGQRILGFGTPESLNAINVQQEFNFHNIMTWEINFVFKLFTLCFGVVLPFLVFHNRYISELARRLKVPVPPITIGIFFLADWIIFKLLIVFILGHGAVPRYYFTCTEIYEFITSFIFLVISIYLFDNGSWIIDGADIKEQLGKEPVKENTQFLPVKSLIHFLAGIF